MKGSAITGPVGKEAAELWPRIASNAGVVMWAAVSGYERTFSLLCGYNTDRVPRFGSDDGCIWAYDTTGSKTGGLALFEWIKDEFTHFPVPAAIWLLSWWKSRKLGRGPFSRSHRIRPKRTIDPFQAATCLTNWRTWIEHVNLRVSTCPVHNSDVEKERESFNCHCKHCFVYLWNSNSNHSDLTVIS